VLKARFGDKKYRTMHYILKKGEVIGAILGYFRYVDNELEDVQIDLPNELRKQYKDDIIDAIYKVYDKEKSPVIRYCGQEI
jgi:hypothetical protein